MSSSSETELPLSTQVAIVNELPLSTQVAIVSELRYLTINNPYMFNAIIVL